MLYSKSRSWSCSFLHSFASPALVLLKETKRPIRLLGWLLNMGLWFLKEVGRWRNVASWTLMWPPEALCGGLDTMFFVSFGARASRLFLWPPRTFSPPFSPLSPSQVLGRLVSRSQAGCHSQSLWPVSLWPASPCHSVPLTCGGLSHRGNLFFPPSTHKNTFQFTVWVVVVGKQLFYCFVFFCKRYFLKIVSKVKIYIQLYERVKA